MNDERVLFEPEQRNVFKKNLLKKINNKYFWKIIDKNVNHLQIKGIVHIKPSISDLFQSAHCTLQNSCRFH